MSFGFQQVSSKVLTPGYHVEVSNERAVQGTPARPAISCLIAYQGATAPNAEGTLLLVTSKEQSEVLFERGSQLAGMADHYFTQDPQGELWCVGLDEAGGSTAATGTHTFTGPATANGTIYLYVGSKRIEVPVASGNTATQIGDAVVAALADVDNTDAHVSAGNAAGVVTYTVKWGGTAGNELPITLNYLDGESLPAGVGVTPTDFDVVMAGGATDADITVATAALGNTAFQFIGSGLNDATNMTALQTFLSARWDAMVQLEGESFVGFCDTVANSSTKTAANNSEFMTIVLGQESVSAPWDYAAHATGVARRRYASDPARPMQGTKMPTLRGPRKGDEWTRAERQTLLDNGGATTKRAVDGTVLVDRLRTSYRQNSQGVNDESFRDLNTMMNLIAQRYDVRTLFALRFPNHKLAIDGTLSNRGQPIVTPSVARAVILGLYRQWELQGLVQDFAGFERDLLVQINASDPNRLDVLLAPRLIGQLRVGAFLLQFILGVPAEAAA